MNAVKTTGCRSSGLIFISWILAICGSIVLHGGDGSKTKIASELSAAIWLKEHLSKYPTNLYIRFNREFLNPELIKLFGGTDIAACEGIWIDNSNYWIRMISIQGNTNNASIYSGQSGSVYWSITGSNILKYDMLNNPNAVISPIGTNFCGAVLMGKKMLENAIGLGMISTRPGTLQWHETSTNEFVAQGHGTSRMQGRLILDREGMPLAIHYGYEVYGGVSHMVEFSFNKAEIGAVMPISCLTSMFSNNKISPWEKNEIIELRNIDIMEESSCAPEHVFKKYGMAEMHYINDILYYKHKRGNIPVETRGGVAIVNVIIWVGIALIMLAPIAIGILNICVKQQHTNKQQGKETVK